MGQAASGSGGDAQSPFDSLPAEERRGWKVLQVMPNSPSSGLGIVPYFSVLTHVDGVRVGPEERDLLPLVKEGSQAQLTFLDLSTLQSFAVSVHPRRGWGGDGLLGLMIRHDWFGEAHLEAFHVLEVHHSSPAERAGLRADSDYLLGTSRIAFKGYTALDLFLAQNQEKEGRVVVYNRATNSVREVLIKPSPNWGGAGSLGCDVGLGFLHQLPIDGKSHVRYEAEDAVAPPQQFQQSQQLQQGHGQQQFQQQGQHQQFSQQQLPQHFQPQQGAPQPSVVSPTTLANMQHANPGMVGVNPSTGEVQMGLAVQPDPSNPHAGAVVMQLQTGVVEKHAQEVAAQQAAHNQAMMQQHQQMQQHHQQQQQQAWEAQQRAHLAQQQALASSMPQQQQQGVPTTSYSPPSTFIPTAGAPPQQSPQQVQQPVQQPPQAQPQFQPPQQPMQAPPAAHAEVQAPTPVAQQQLPQQPPQPPQQQQQPQQAVTLDAQQFAQYQAYLQQMQNQQQMAQMATMQLPPHMAAAHQAQFAPQHFAQQQQQQQQLPQQPAQPQQGAPARAPGADATGLP